MKNVLLLLNVIIITTLMGCKVKNNMKEHKYTNDLIHEASPYLLQHAHNPVNWVAWNEESLQKAKDEDKLMIISVGYAACHWCHVMEHESFEDSTVASIMNEHFVCIKVDREERPDVDDVYMTACQITSNRGCGWPLNAFALPDGLPVWAGTYFPKDQWIGILEQFVKIKEEDPNRLEKSAESIMQGINSMGEIVVNENGDLSQEELAEITTKALSNIDYEDGGMLGAPKFPMPNIFEYLLQYHQLTDNDKALQAATTTLDKMALGGIYDQLGGGFARYSVDSIWLAPHFEKMLYDNGQLLSLYAHAYQKTKSPLYKKVVDQTIAFAERELLDPSGGYYSSLDADSEGEEGKFYVWQVYEIDSLLSRQEAEVVKDYYSIRPQGNWEHVNILYVNDNFDPSKYGLDESKLQAVLTSAHDKLMAHRSQRIRPGTDDKILTSWNGLLLSGLVDAYKALGTESYKTKAISLAQFISDKAMQKDGRLDRNYKNGQSTINGFLDDYASVIEAFIGVYEITFDEQWLDKAKKLTDYVDKHFTDDKTQMYYYTSDLDPALVTRKMELTDNVISASNSIMSKNLYKLGTILYEEDMVARSRQMLLNMVDDISTSRSPNYYSNWLQLYAWSVYPYYEVAILGEKAQAQAAQMQASYSPNTLYLGGKTEGNLKLLQNKLQEEATMIYVCQNKSCRMPTEDSDVALGLMKY